MARPHDQIDAAQTFLLTAKDFASEPIAVVPPDCGWNKSFTDDYAEAGPKAKVGTGIHKE